jgi:hypothetical protein
MKKVLATLTLAGALVTVPLVAQAYPTATTTTDSTSPSETATAKTLTGTVVSSNSTELVLQTSTGQKTIQLSELATPPANLSVGTQVTVSYRDVDGQMIASDLTVGTGTDDTAAWTTPPVSPDEDPMAGARATARADADPAPAVDTEAQDDEFLAGRDVDVDADADVRATAGAYATDDPRVAARNIQDEAQVDDALPATASDVPLIALLGALALVSAGVLRRIH